MATSEITIYSGAADGYVSSTGGGTAWPVIRDAHTGSSGFAGSPGLTTAVRATVTTARGVSTYVITRSFFSFDVSGITHVPKSAQVELFGYTYGYSDVILVKSSWNGIGLATSDFDSIVGWDGTNSDGTGGGSEIGNVTRYSEEVSTWDLTDYNRITLSQQALLDIAGEGELKCCIIDHDSDLRDIAASSASNYTGFYYANYIGTTRDPKLVIQTQDDSVFFGANF